MNGRVVAFVASIVVAVAVIAGVTLMGSPTTERARRLDDARVDDLAALRSAIAHHYRVLGVLPDSLPVLPGGGDSSPRSVDPVSGEPYGYERIDARTFRLCATFDLASSGGDGRYRDDVWSHGAGRQCFRLGIERADKGIISDPILEPTEDREP